MGTASPERHREVAVTPRCSSRFHRSEARERPYQSDAEKSLAFSLLGDTRATRSDVSQRPGATSRSDPSRSLPKPGATSGSDYWRSLRPFCFLDFMFTQGPFGHFIMHVFTF
ncbi:hypothetical protein DY000_02005031 [Brassica cretica]|uniref:Uncharacterized protein n=1 Tax=Brassica cretica TaxID=69181 RepID=A0ABQ7C8P2_BRACR|nr:hypothetical protein DY000_02005031 [Brassica cretica]